MKQIHARCMTRRCSMLLGAILSLVGTATYAAPPHDRFTIAVIPDTQNYVDYTHQTAEGFPFDASRIFLEQMKYIAEHAESQGGDIAFVTAVGDLWQHSSIAMDPEHEARGFKRGLNHPLFDRYYLQPTPKTRSFEMPTIRSGYELIAGKVPFSVVPGNHDYDAQWTDANHPPGPRYQYGLIHMGGLTNFAQVFSPDSSFFKGKQWYVGSHDGGADSAQIFTAGGYRFLHIGLQFDAPNASLAWAASIIARFPGLPTLISTHKYLNPDGEHFANPEDNSTIDAEDNNPQMVWEKLVSRHDQIFMVLSGHRCGQGFGLERNRFGHHVYQILADYQCRWQVAKDAGMKEKGKGIGDGWMRLMSFEMGAEPPTVRVRTYSTHYKKFSTDIPQYAARYKADETPVLTDAEFNARDDFALELADFRARFGKPTKHGENSASAH